MSSERSRRIALLEQRTSKDLGFHDPDPDARGTGIYSGIGDVLRQARERRGLSLQEVAAHLRISETYLAAIECGRFSQLPGRSYVLGFLRSYGSFLDLNADKVVAQYKAEDDDDFARKQQLKFPTVRPEGRTPGLWLLPVVTIVAAVGYLGWYGWKTELVSFDAIVPDVPARLQADSPSAEGSGDRPASALAATGQIGDGQIATGPVSTGRAAADRAADGVAADGNATGAPNAVAGLLDRGDGGDNTGEDMRLARTGAGPESGSEPGAVSQAGSAASGTAAAVAGTGDLTEESPGGEEAAPDAQGADAAATDGTARPADGRTAADASEPPPLPSDPAAGLSAAGDTARPDNGGGTQLAGNLASDGSAVAAGAGPGRVFGTEGSRVVLRASADTWVQVEDAQRNLLLTRVLKAGDIYRAPNQRGLMLMTGNAGGLVVEVDGAAIPSLGPRGAVRRNVSLDPERLLDGSQLVN